MTPVRPPTSSSREVLIIEHDDAIRKLLVTLVEKNGCTALGAATLSEASCALTMLDYALVIYDTHLPGALSLSIPRFLRDHPGMAMTPIIAVSSDDAPEYIDATMAAGANQFLVKPIQRDEIRKLLQHYSLVSGSEA